jgi:hypothetical protein
VVVATEVAAVAAATGAAVAVSKAEENGIERPRLRGIDFAEKDEASRLLHRFPVYSKAKERV